jgi:hypothetical protein
MYVLLSCELKKLRLTQVWQDNCRVISFSKGHGNLAQYHLETGQVDPKYHPLPLLLRDHLAQAVFRHCLFPEWKICYELPPSHFDGTSTDDYQFQEEWESGNGKFYFEMYLDAALPV